MAMDATVPAESHLVLVFGEVLFDLFADGEEVLGGAPFNVAWHLCGFDQKPVMISRVGEDRRGEAVLETMTRWGMRTDGIQTDSGHPTGLVKATVKDGQPHFSIEADQAYDFIASAPARATVATLASEPTLLYHGSLALRNPVSRDSLRALRAEAGASVFVDVNLRAPWWENDTITACLDHAHWAKVNDDELQALGEDRQPDGAAAEVMDEERLALRAKALVLHHGLAGVIVTRGAAGALWLDYEGELVSAAPVPVSAMVDTVGAGDAFAAVCLLGALRGWQPAVMLRRAAAFAARVCGQQGATIQEPALYEETQEIWEGDGDPA